MQGSVSPFCVTVASRVARIAAKRGDAEIGTGEFSTRHGVGHDLLDDGFEAVVARVVEVIGLGGGKHDAFDAAPKEDRTPAILTLTETGENRFERVAEILDRGPGPAFSAASASTRTICRSSRAKWPKKKGRTTFET